MPYCQECGAKVAEDVLFCDSCVSDSSDQQSYGLCKGQIDGIMDSHKLFGLTGFRIILIGMYILSSGVVGLFVPPTIAIPLTGWCITPLWFEWYVFSTIILLLTGAMLLVLGLQVWPAGKRKIVKAGDT